MNGTSYSKGISVTVSSIEENYTVKKTGSTYRSASGATVDFSNNQSASLNLVEGGLGTGGVGGNAYWHNTGLSTVYCNGYNYYFVSDTWNNRVLVYKVPESETWGYGNHAVTEYLYCVLGQTSTETNKAGYELDELNWPNEAVATVEGNVIKLFVTDTANNRILVWNNLLEIEKKFGPSADYSIMEKCDVNKVDYENGYLKDKSLRNSHESGIKWPWAIWTDGTRLMCTSTQDGYLLVWDSLPSKEDKYPDRIIYTGGTVRTIACRDNYVILGDHNIQTTDNRNMAGVKIIEDYTNLIYTEITDKENADARLFEYTEIENGTAGYSYYLVDGHQPSGTFLTKELLIEGGEKLPAGTLLLSCVGAIEVRRDGRIDGPDDNPDYYIGGGVVDDTRLYYFTSADYAPVIVDHSGNLYNSMGNKGMIAGYKAGTLPSEPEEITADIIRQQDGDVFMYNGQMYYCKQNKDKPEKHCTAVPNSWIGSENVTDNAYKKTYRYQNCMVSSDGKHLVASSDCGTGSVLMLWKNLPDESEAIPDTVYEFDMLDTLNDTAVYTDGAATMLMAGGRNSLYIWNNINTALAGEVPDYYLREKIGNVAVNEIQSFAFDGTYFYLSDNNGIYIFNGIPTKDQAPESTLNYQGASIEVTNCENGITYLAIKANEPVIYTREEALKNGEKYVLKGAVRELVVGVENGSKDGKYITEQDQICRFGGVGGIIVTKEGKVMVSDNGFGRIIIWDSIDEAVNEGNTNVKSATRTELGYGNHYYNIYDVLFADDSNQYHSMVYDIIPIESSDTFYRPYSLAYDGMYLWVGDFKFSGGIKRFR